MDTWPVEGCSGCATTLGRYACPVHGQNVGTTALIEAEPVFTIADKERLFRALDRITELLEISVRIRR